MHDPHTVAHRIKVFGRDIATIWHVDPETDGTDDSCGWSNPRLTIQQRKIISDMVEHDLDFPYYGSPNLPVTQVDPAYKYPQIQAGDCLALVAAAWNHIAWSLDRRNINMAEWATIVNIAANPHDNLRAVLADKEKHDAARFLFCVMRAYLLHHRPWYRHPQWHIHHWELQVHPLRTFKRWAFSRCHRCMGRFAWGEVVVSHIHDSDGPQWFESEKRLFHKTCSADELREGRDVK